MSVSLPRMGDLLVQILFAIGGGIGSVFLDEKFTDPDGILRPRTIGSVEVGPGAQASVGLALILAFLPSSVLGAKSTIRIGLASAASGGIVTQGTAVLGKHVLPILRGEKAPTGQLPANTAAAGYGWPQYAGYGWGVGHQPTPTSYEVQRGVEAMRHFAQQPS